MKKRGVELTVLLVVFLFFVGMSFGMVMMGAKVYKRIERDTQEQFDKRTPMTYIMMKVRQNDRQGGVQVRTIASIPALVLIETIEDMQYETWIYTYQGYLREIYIAAGSEWQPEDGQCVLPLKELKVDRVEEGAVQLDIQTVEGWQTQMRMKLKAGGRGE